LHSTPNAHSRTSPLCTDHVFERSIHAAVAGSHQIETAGSVHTASSVGWWVRRTSCTLPTLRPHGPKLNSNHLGDHEIRQQIFGSPLSKITGSVHAVSSVKNTTCTVLASLAHMIPNLTRSTFIDTIFISQWPEGNSEALQIACMPEWHVKTCKLAHYLHSWSAKLQIWFDAAPRMYC